MTLRLKRCVSLFVCLSLLVSACSSDKSDKSGSKAPVAKITGVLQEEKTVDERRWYKPTALTLGTEVAGGLAAGVVAHKFWSDDAEPEKGKEAEAEHGERNISYVGGMLTAVAGGGLASIVTTAADVGAVGGGVLGTVAGAVGGGVMGGLVLSVAKKMLMSSEDDWMGLLFTGAWMGAIPGAIVGLLTGIETGWMKPAKPETTTKPADENKQDENQQQGEQKDKEPAATVK